MLLPHNASNVGKRRQQGLDLRAFVRRRVQTDADDVVQDLLTKLVQHGPPSGSVHAWLFTVTRHVIIDRSRTRRNHVGAGALELAEESPGEEATGELARCLGPMMSALSLEERLVLTRVDLHGEFQAGLARELGVSTSGIKSRVQRARRRLRALVESCCSIACDRRGKPFDYLTALGKKPPEACQGIGRPRG